MISGRLSGTVLPIGKSIRETARTFSPPLVAFALAQIGLTIAAILGGFPAFRAASWARLDSGHYIDNAVSGYTLFHCAPPNVGEWCGTAGWFPGYSLVVAPFVEVGLPPLASALVISELFCLGTLALWWAGLLGARATYASFIALIFAAFTPGHIYDHAVFPLAMASFFLVLTLLLIQRRRYLAAGLAGAVVAASYPTGLMVAPAALIGLTVAEPRTPLLTRIRSGCTVGGLTLLGLLVVLTVSKLETGAWDAFFKVQAKYHHKRRDPFTAWWDLVSPLFEGQTGISTVSALEALLAASVVVTVIYYALRRRRAMTALESTIVALVVAVWLLPLSYHASSPIRSDALMLPAGLLLARLPRPVSALIVGCAVLLSVPMATAFLKKVII